MALVLGIALGAALHSRADTPWIVAVNVNILRPIGQIFLRSILMVVVPMALGLIVYFLSPKNPPKSATLS